jgi:16S rRNA (cytosine1402-N4)-methyltransferase
MAQPEFHHLPVLLDAVLAHLAPRPGEVVLDGTVGGGGHAVELLRRVLPDGWLHGIDRDPAAHEAAGARLRTLSDRFTLHRATFDQLGTLGLPPLDAILLDVGVSSPQLDRPDRGFSFRTAGPLDMRMDPDAPTTAEDLLRDLPEAELARILYEYGEERHSRRIARELVKRRTEGAPFADTLELAGFVQRLVPRDPSGIHGATRTFQALRIAVNDELGMLRRALPAAVAALAPGGRLGVISFHSLEDRLVKQFFQAEAKGCVCPPRIPMCVCGKPPTLAIVTPKPVVATPDEANCNPRARSAKLRVARRLPAPS